VNASRHLSAIPGGKTDDMPSPSPTDDALWQACLDGDEAAFGALVERHRRLVFGVVRRYARTEEDARDLCQQVFLRAVDSGPGAFPRLRAGGVPFRAWLCRVAVNLGKNHVRQAARWTQVPLLQGPEAATGPQPVEALERAEKERRAKDCVLRLPPRQRKVLTLRIDGGLSFEEIAQALAITANSAKVNYHHAVRRLTEMIAAEEGARP
jgi:RNA polymerase sigma-70 factor (ECF subfamily)